MRATTWVWFAVMMVGLSPFAEAQEATPGRELVRRVFERIESAPGRDRRHPELVRRIVDFSEFRILSARMASGKSRYFNCTEQEEPRVIPSSGSSSSGFCSMVVSCQANSTDPGVPSFPTSLIAVCSPLMGREGATVDQCPNAQTCVDDMGEEIPYRPTAVRLRAFLNVVSEPTGSSSGGISAAPAPAVPEETSAGGTE